MSFDVIDILCVPVIVIDSIELDLEDTIDYEKIVIIVETPPAAEIRYLLIEHKDICYQQYMLFGALILVPTLLTYSKNFYNVIDNLWSSDMPFTRHVVVSYTCPIRIHIRHAYDTYLTRF